MNGGSPGDDRRERRLERIVEGYGRVFSPAVAALAKRIQPSSIVTAVEWQRHRTRIHYTSPAIRFTPPLPSKIDAMSRLAMGDVVRVVFRFRTRFWADERLMRRLGAPDLDQLGFLHTTDATFPTWWSAYPGTAPVLVAWCGDPAARTLSGLGARDITLRALHSLGVSFGIPPQRLRRELAQVWTHDWINDPFARGVYSYQMVGGNGASRDLARPIDGTLFFAGEATDISGSTGTVHGAIASGARAATQVLRALRTVK